MAHPERNAQKDEIFFQMRKIVKQYQLGDEVSTVLKDVDLDVQEGEYLSVLGPSGSGKSTLMNIIGCLDLPTSGEYILRGNLVEEMDEKELAHIRRREIGFIFQNSQMLQRMDAMRNVELPLIYAGIRPRERARRAEEMLVKVGLQDRLHHYPNQLSGGQQQRVAIARALVTHPSLLLADEPTGALDQATGRQIMALFNELNRDGHTIIMITHDVNIARRILAAAEAYGIPREDVWIDCLTLTVSAQQEQAEETLAAVRTVRHDLGLNTVLGVSNISFGLPNRLLITTAFLLRALEAGLTLPIVNPNQKEIMDAVAAFRALSGEDPACRGYVERFAQASPTVKAVPTSDMTLGDAIQRGLKADAARLAKAALQDRSELSLVEECLIPALDKVGADYERGAAFLPQLLSAAQAAQSVFEVIRQSLADKGSAPVKKGRILIATVQGDIHDIGKNIVRTVLENYGYEVTDLGRDVPPETIAETAQREHIRLVGLSALMTTTLPAMEKTTRLLLALPEPPAVMVGGAVVTEDYAGSIGAIYARDAKASVEIARRILS